MLEQITGGPGRPVSAQGHKLSFGAHELVCCICRDQRPTVTVLHANFKVQHGPAITLRCMFLLQWCATMLGGQQTRSQIGLSAMPCGRPRGARAAAAAGGQRFTRREAPVRRHRSWQSAPLGRIVSFGSSGLTILFDG